MPLSIAEAFASPNVEEALIALGLPVNAATREAGEELRRVAMTGSRRVTGTYAGGEHFDQEWEERWEKAETSFRRAVNLPTSPPIPGKPSSR